MVSRLRRLKGAVLLHGQSPMKEGRIRSEYLPFHTQVPYQPRQNDRPLVMFGTSLCRYHTTTYSFCYELRRPDVAKQKCCALKHSSSSLAACCSAVSSAHVYAILCLFFSFDMQLLVALLLPSEYSYLTIYCKALFLCQWTARKKKKKS
ncbi:hypothetical protein TNCV_2471891 [Trichonephila clavipes]|nr:hypothetical protein TNCV_2471891 [Trichonephila clavipes]